MIEAFFAKYGVPVALAVVAFLTPIHTLMLVVGALMILDLITGVWAAVKRGEPITSRRMGRTVGKMLVYQLAIISGYLIEYGLGGLLPVSKLVGAAITLVEGTSVLENLNKLSGVNILKSVLDRLTSQK